MARINPNIGYRPGGVSYYRPPPRRPIKMYTPPVVGYAPGGVSYHGIAPGSQVGPGGGPKIAPGGDHTVNLYSPTGGPLHGGGRGGVSDIAPGARGKPKKKLTLWEQAQILINKALNPQLAAINAQYDRERAAQTASIASATKEYERAVGQYAPDMAAAYAQAQGAQSGSDLALTNLLAGKGSGAATELASQLGALPGKEAAAGLQAIGRGAAATNYAMGSADLDRLISQGAHAQEYGRKLPGLAALTGLEDTRTAVSALGRQRMDALGQARATGAQQTLSLWQQLHGEALSAKAAAADRAFKQQLAIQSGLVKATAASTKADAAANKLLLPNPTLSGKYGYIVDSHGKPILQNGQRIPIVKTGKQAGPPKLNTTASAAYKYQVDQYGHPILDAKGNRIPYKGAAGGGGGGGKTPQQKAGDQKVKALNDVRRLQREIKSNVSVTNPITHKVTTTTTRKRIQYPALVRRAMALPSVQLLMTRFNYSQAEVRKMIDQQLAAYGVKPGWALPGKG